MGQGSSRDYQEAEYRLEQIGQMAAATVWEAQRLLPLAEAEKAAGIPPTPGSSQAAHKAALDYYLVLADEQSCIWRRQSALRQGLPNPPPMPPPTPPPPPKGVAEDKAQPGTPARGNSGPHGGRPRTQSSSREGFGAKTARRARLHRCWRGGGQRRRTGTCAVGSGVCVPRSGGASCTTEALPSTPARPAACLAAVWPRWSRPSCCFAPVDIVPLTSALPSR